MARNWRHSLVNNCSVKELWLRTVTLLRLDLGQNAQDIEGEDWICLICILGFFFKFEKFAEFLNFL